MISLALTQIEGWEAARGLFVDSSGTALLTGFAMVALFIAVILLFWVFYTYRRSEHHLNLKIAELSVINIKQKQQITKLTDTNEKLRQENTELYRKQVEVLETVKEGNPSVESSRN